MQFRNYRGEMLEAPKDEPIIVAEMHDGLIVWSRTEGNSHQVRYGLQVERFDNDIDASEEFGHCVLHHATCDGLLDDKDNPTDRQQLADELLQERYCDSDCYAYSDSSI